MVPGLRTLNGPVNDAARFARILTSQGLAPERIVIFADGDPGAGLTFPVGIARDLPSGSRLQSFFQEELPATEARDLVLFWGGHGSIAREARRLFISGSSGRNPFTIDLDDLIRFLRSCSFGPDQFTRQIIVSDVCANVSNAANGAPGMTFNSQPPRDGVEQFVLYAASPNQSAINLVKRQTGLLSSEFFREIEGRTKEWPWNMEQIAKGLQNRFVDLRNQGYPHQTPTFLWNRDWQGNDSTFGNELIAPSLPTGESQRPRLKLRELMKLATVLVEIPNFRTPTKLDMVLTEGMRPVIVGNFVPNNSPMENALGLLKLCQDYPPALEELMEALALVEQGSQPMANALAAYREVCPFLTSASSAFAGWFPRSAVIRPAISGLKDAVALTRAYRNSTMRGSLLEEMGDQFSRLRFEDTDNLLSELKEIIRGNGLLTFVIALIQLQEPEDRLRAIQDALETLLTFRNLSSEQFVGLVEGLQPLETLLGPGRQLASDMTNSQTIIDADWSEIVLVAGECRIPPKGTSFVVEYLQSLWNVAEKDSDRQAIKGLVGDLGGEIDETSRSVVAAKALYLVMELTPDDLIKGAHAVTITPWIGDVQDSMVSHPGRTRLPGIAENDILSAIGTWLNDFLVKYSGPKDRLVVEFVLPRKLFCHKLHKAKLGCPEQDGPFVKELGSVVAWTIRPSDYRKSGIRKANLDLRWSPPPAKVVQIEWVGQPPASVVDSFQTWSSQPAEGERLRCIALGYEPPDEVETNDDIVLALSAAGVPAVVWFHSVEDGKVELEEKVRTAFLEKELDELPLIMRDKRLSKPPDASWNNSTLVLDHHKRMPAEPPQFQEVRQA